MFDCKIYSRMYNVQLLLKGILVGRKNNSKFIIKKKLVNLDNNNFTLLNIIQQKKKVQCIFSQNNHIAQIFYFLLCQINTKLSLHLGLSLVKNYFKELKQFFLFSIDIYVRLYHMIKPK